MFSFHPAASVLSGVDHSVNHHMASVGNDGRVHGDSPPCGGDSAGAGPSAPSGGAGAAGAVGRGLEGSKRNQAAV